MTFHRFLVVATVLGSACWPAAATGQEITFEVFGTIELTNPQTVISCDLDEDGHRDLVVASTVNNALFVYFGEGTGAFQSPFEYWAPTPLALITADFDGDGHLDIATSSLGNGGVSIYLGDGAGSLGPGEFFPTGASPRGMAAADLNGDGHLDLAVANHGSHTISVLSGDGLGGFSASSEITELSSPTAVVAGDFDLDGDMDLAAVTSLDSTITQLYGPGESAGHERMERIDLLEAVEGLPLLLPRHLYVGDRKGVAKKRWHPDYPGHGSFPSRTLSAHHRPGLPSAA